jgi:hypothetical protein
VQAAISEEVVLGLDGLNLSKHCGFEQHAGIAD